MSAEENEDPDQYGSMDYKVRKGYCVYIGVSENVWFYNIFFVTRNLTSKTK